MRQYSVAGIEISLQEEAPAGGYRLGTARRFAMRNCEWSAELFVHDGWRAPLEPTSEVSPAFTAGNHDKFRGDLARIQPLLRALLAPPGGTVVLHLP